MHLDKAIDLQHKIATRLLGYKEIPTGQSGGVGVTFPSYERKADHAVKGLNYQSLDEKYDFEREAVTRQLRKIGIGSYTDQMSLGDRTGYGYDNRRELEEVVEKLLSASSERMIGVSISFSRLNESTSYGVKVLCQRHMDMASPIIQEMKAMCPDVEVTYCGPIVAQNLTMGSCASDYRIPSGSLGCFVKCNQTGKICLLSAGHVLNPLNINAPNTPIGEILSPCPLNGGVRPNHVVASLLRGVPLDMTRVNQVDCALASFVNGYQPTGNEVDGFPRPGVTAQLRNTTYILDGNKDIRQLLVHHKGAASGQLKSGRVATINTLATQLVRLDGHYHSLEFEGLVEIEGLRGDFSIMGDSGSIFFTDTAHPAGMVIAGTNSGGTFGGGITFGVRLEKVLSALDCSLI
ncbi:MAG: hypothetical protein AAGC95_02490 [Pseudomonadota bacterium]